MTCGECKDKENCPIYEKGAEDLICIYEMIRQREKREGIKK